MSQANIPNITPSIDFTLSSNKDFSGVDILSVPDGRVVFESVGSYQK